MSHRRWVVLAVGTLSQAATCSFLYGIPLLVPALNRAGLSLLGASFVVSAPVAGLLLTLVAWGALADRYGERIVMATGTGLAAVALFGAASSHGTLALGLLLGMAGAAGGSVNAASGRVVMGWFPVRERGLAMGTRQTAQPLGVAVAALALPPLAAAHGAHLALLFPAAFCAVMCVAILGLVVDPARPASNRSPPAVSPYRGSSTLLRVHAASSLLVFPQFAVSSFTLAYLVAVRHWDASAAGRLIFAFQAVGAFGRVASGVWSDRVGSRLGPMRQLAVMSAVLMALLALGAQLHAGWIVVVFGFAAVVTVADNGLAYVSVAEIAGSAWSGRALGIHNTVQNLVAVTCPPMLAALIGAHARYGLAFGVVTALPLLAVPLTPLGAEHRRAGPEPGRSTRSGAHPRAS